MLGSYIPGVQVTEAFLALVDLPDFTTPLQRIAASVEKLSGSPPPPDLPDGEAPPKSRKEH